MAVLTATRLGHAPVIKLGRLTDLGDDRVELDDGAVRVRAMSMPVTLGGWSAGPSESRGGRRRRARRGACGSEYPVRVSARNSAARRSSSCAPDDAVRFVPHDVVGVVLGDDLGPAVRDRAR